MNGPSWVGGPSPEAVHRLRALAGRALSEQIADAMFALSTPSRVQILSTLVEGPHTVGELTDLLGMEQSAVSHQLRILREHNLVRAERAGRRRVYQLESEHLTVLLGAALDHATRVARGGSGIGRGHRASGET